MDKKPYEPPEIRSLGSVFDLTAGTAPPCNGSALCDLATDASAVIQDPY